MLCIQVNLTHQKPFILIPWYRPPDSSIHVFDLLETVLENVEATSLDYLLIGDINCDLLQNNPTCHTKRLLQIAREYNLHQHVEKPTRVTQSTSSLIDCAFSSNISKIKQCEIFCVTLSDHYMVGLSWGNTKPPSNDNHCYTRSRNTKKIDFDQLNQELQDIAWDDVLGNDDVQKAYNTWETKFSAILDRHAPVKKKRVRQKRSPWMNKLILDSMHRRDRFKRIAKRSKSDRDWQDYRNLRNLVTSLIRKEKKKYITVNILKNRGNSGEMWKLLKFLCPQKKNIKLVQKIIVNNTEVIGNKSIANALTIFSARLQKFVSKV